MNAKEFTPNHNEKKVLEALKRAKGPLHLSDLAKRAFGKRRLSKEKANSWARNSIRRAVKFRQVKQTERGTYTFVGTKGASKKASRKARNATKSVEHKSKAAEAAKSAEPGQIVSKDL